MLVTDKPEDIPTTNALDNVEDPDANLEIKPAYLALGTTPPAAVVNPPAVGDIEYFMVRTRCTGEHGPLLRSDGEVRYRRDLQIQAIWKPGDPEPEIEKTQAQKDAESAAEAAANQPTLFDGQDPTPTMRVLTAKGPTTSRMQRSKSTRSTAPPLLRRRIARGHRERALRRHRSRVPGAVRDLPAACHGGRPAV